MPVTRWHCGDGSLARQVVARHTLGRPDDTTANYAGGGQCDHLATGACTSSRLVQHSRRSAVMRRVDGFDSRCINASSAAKPVGQIIGSVRHSPSRTPATLSAAPHHPRNQPTAYGVSAVLTVPVLACAVIARVSVHAQTCCRGTYTDRLRHAACTKRKDLPLEASTSRPVALEAENE